MCVDFGQNLFEGESVGAEKGLGGQQAVGGDAGLGSALGTADADAVIEHLDLVFALARGTAAMDLSLGFELADDEEDDIVDLRVAEGLRLMQGVEAVDACFLHQFHQLELVLGQRGFDVVGLADEAGVKIGVGAGEGEELTAEEEALGEGVLVGLGAEDAGDGKADLGVAAALDDQLALAAVAFELEHIAREGEKADGAHDARAAMGAAIGNGGLFGGDDHSIVFLYS